MNIIIEKKKNTINYYKCWPFKKFDDGTITVLSHRHVYVTSHACNILKILKNILLCLVKNDHVSNDNGTIL